MDDSVVPVVESPKPNRSRLWWGIGIGCVVLLCCLAAAGGILFWRWSQSGGLTALVPESDPLQGFNVPESFDFPRPDKNTLGDPNAKVVVEVYSDFQCPYCARYVRETERQLIREYVATGKVYYVYHSMGSFIGPESGAAAEAAYCAGDQDLFWPYHDLLMYNQNGENTGDFSAGNLDKFARGLNLDDAAFQSCVSSHKYADRVSQDAVDAAQAGINGVPSFVINGQLAIQGAYPFEEFQKAIDKLLSQ
jgi:protein-disulfide isomerase